LKPVVRKIKLFIGLFVWSLILIAVFIVSYGMSFTTIDLNKVDKLSGNIISADTHSKDLVIFVDGEKKGFWIYRASHDYSDIISSLSAGTPVKLYYKARAGSNGYFTAYQLETSNAVIYSKDEYERKEKLAGRFIGLPGAFVMLGVLIFETRKRYRAISRTHHLA